MMTASTMRLGVSAVLVTIVLGSCVFIQGVYERRLDNGMVTVRVGDRLFTGRPANSGSFA